MEIQTRVAPAELWLRDDLENIYALLFRFLGFGFRLAISNVGWHATQKFVILVPDPIAFAPWPVLLDPGEPCDISQYTSFWRLFAGLFVTPRSKDDMSDSPTIATALTATATVTLCFVCVCASFCPMSYHKSTGGRSSSATSSRRRSTGRSRRVAAASRRSGRSARRAGAREARFVHVVDLARQSRAMVVAWWNPCTGLIARQMEELEVDFVCVCTLFGLHFLSQDDGGG